MQRENIPLPTKQVEKNHHNPLRKPFKLFDFSTLYPGSYSRDRVNFEPTIFRLAVH